jgi:hypothetical protein
VSLAVLTQVYDEVRRLAIAGSVVAPGDFRLKKLSPPLEKAGEKAPVFAKVAGSVTKLIESNEKTSAEALLEVSTLVNAILYTQGETGAAGELGEIETADIAAGHHTRTTARMLKPLLEALTTTGSGRLEVIKDAFERGVFNDLRLLKPALAAIDDPYPEIGDLVAQKILPLYGKAILPDLRAKFDIKGKGGHCRRLMLMHRLDPDGSGPLVKEALDNGSKEMKVVAIECLGTWPDRLKSLLRPLSYLLEQAAAKAKEVRQAALKALAKSDEGEATAALESALKSGDIELAVAPIRESTNPKLLQCVLMEADAQLAKLLAGKEKDKKAAGKQVERMLALLECLRGKGEKAAESFLLKCFAAREKLAAIKGEPSGADIVERLVELMALGSKGTQNALVDARETLSPENLQQAFAAARKTRKPAEVFDLFSPCVTAKVDEKKKGRDPAGAKRAAVIGALLSEPYFNPATGVQEYDALKDLDPRWLDVAVAQKDLNLVKILARPGHEGASALLASSFAETFKTSKDWEDCHLILESMVRIKHPSATKSLTELLAKHAKGTHSYTLYYIGRLIPSLPKEAVPELEALLPTLPEKAIDQLLGYVTELKNKP